MDWLGYMSINEEIILGINWLRDDFGKIILMLVEKRVWYEWDLYDNYCGIDDDGYNIV